MRCAYIVDLPQVLAWSTSPPGIKRFVRSPESKRRFREQRWPATLRPVTRGVGFARLLAVPAANGEWQRPQPSGGDVISTLGTAPVEPVIQSRQSSVDSLHRLALQLHESELDVLLNICFRYFPLVLATDVVGRGALLPKRCQPFTDTLVDLSSTSLEKQP
jgi:hypothetical protein